MKKTVFLLIICVILCGCKKEKAPEHRVVTGIQVEYHQGENVLHQLPKNGKCSVYAELS